MIDTALITTLSQSEVENTNLFPFPFTMHIGLAVIGLLFFVFRFFTDKKPYQIIFALAIPFSLTLWATESRKWFYIVGVIEFILILAAFVSTFFFKDKPAEAAPAEPEADTAPAEPEADTAPVEEVPAEAAEELPADESVYTEDGTGSDEE